MPNSVTMHPDGVYRPVNSGDTVIFSVLFSNLPSLAVMPALTLNFTGPGGGSFSFFMLGVQDLATAATYNFSALIPTGIPSGNYSCVSGQMLDYQGFHVVGPNNGPPGIKPQYCLDITSSLPAESRTGASGYSTFQFK
jgi:hypothetical protein